MKATVIDTGGEQKKLLPKFRQVARLARERGVRSLLDVGCRDCILYTALQAEGLDAIWYAGADLFQNEAGTVDYVGDITRGIAVDSGSYDMVSALDVLEHLDDLQAGLDELDRIARRYIVVALPNMAHFQFRVRLLLKGRLNSKYDLKYGYGADRHRWVTVLPQTDDYFRRYCADKGYTLQTVYTSLGSPRLSRLENVFKALRFRPAWYVWAAFYIIDKGERA